MQYAGKKIRSFTDLLAWQQAHELAIQIYKLIKSFPSYEQFALSDQLRRSAISVTSNIAEGFSRANKKEKIQFYFIAKSSLTEMHNQLLLSRDVGYISSKECEKLVANLVKTSKLIYGLIRSATSRNF